MSAAARAPGSAARARARVERRRQRRLGHLGAARRAARVARHQLAQCRSGVRGVRVERDADLHLAVRDGPAAHDLAGERARLPGVVDLEPDAPAGRERTVRDQARTAQRHLAEEGAPRAPAGSVADGQADRHPAGAPALRAAVERVAQQQAERGRVDRPPHDPLDAELMEPAPGRPRAVLRDDDRARLGLGEEGADAERAGGRRDHEVEDAGDVGERERAAADDELASELAEQHAEVVELSVVADQHLHVSGSRSPPFPIGFGTPQLERNFRAARPSAGPGRGRLLGSAPPMTAAARAKTSATSRSSRTSTTARRRCVDGLLRSAGALRAAPGRRPSA